MGEAVWAAQGLASIILFLSIFGCIGFCLFNWEKDRICSAEDAEERRSSR